MDFCDLNIKDQFGIILDIGVKVSLYGTRRARLNDLTEDIIL